MDDSCPSALLGFWASGLLGFWDRHMPKSRSRDLRGKGAFIMKIVTVELDLAKTSFQVHAIDSQEHIDTSSDAGNCAALTYYRFRAA
jgi:hypothetical protein